MRSLVVAIKMTVVLTLLTGIVYPIAMAGLGHVLFPAQADGSLIYQERITGRIIADSSELQGGSLLSSPPFCRGNQRL